MENFISNALERTELKMSLAAGNSVLEFPIQSDILTNLCFQIKKKRKQSK